jgi:hypothetical protein
MGSPDSGRAGLFELICGDCGDHLYLDYSSEVPARLQRLRGPRTIRAALAAACMPCCASWSPAASLARSRGQQHDPGRRASPASPAREEAIFASFSRSPVPGPQDQRGSHTHAQLSQRKKLC